MEPVRLKPVSVISGVLSTWGERGVKCAGVGHHRCLRQVGELVQRGRVSSDGSKRAVVHHLARSKIRSGGVQSNGLVAQQVFGRALYFNFIPKSIGHVCCSSYRFCQVRYVSCDRVSLVLDDPYSCGHVLNVIALLSGRRLDAFNLRVELSITRLQRRLVRVQGYDGSRVSCKACVECL